MAENENREGSSAGGGEPPVSKSLAKALISALTAKNGEDGKGRFEERVYAQKLRKKLPEIRTIGNDWFAYSGAAWAETTRDEFGPLAMATIPPRYRKERNEQSLLNHIQLTSQVKADSFIGFHRFFEEADGMRSLLINVANGVVKVWPEGEVTLEKHDPRWGFTGHLAANHDPVAKCPLFQALLASALPDEQDHALLQGFAGNVLWPSAEYETALISFGRGGTSKSTIAEAVAFAMVHPDQVGTSKLCTSISMAELCNPKSYSLPDLRWSGLNLVTEIDTVEMDESTNFKLIISGETIIARPIYGKPQHIRSSCKLWAISNNLPRFKCGTDSELRRLRFIHHDVKIDDSAKDVGLKMRLRSERDGIFQWMLEGLLKLQRDQRVPIGGAKSRELFARFQVTNDPVGTFVQDRCRFNQSASISSQELKEAFNAFASESGLPDGVDGIFLQRFYEKYSSLQKRRAALSGKTMIHGIELLPLP